MWIVLRCLREDVMQSAGIAECVSKPLKQSLLHDALVRALAGKRKTRERSAHEPSKSLPMRERVRVLVAEDNPVNQKLAVRQLERLGVPADPVANGAEAIEALSRIPYDLVLMDCQMPEMDGFEATREIRRREGTLRHTPVIALTANALEGDRERCLAAGMDDYLSKPVRQHELLALIEKWLPDEGSPLDEAVVANLRSLSTDSEDFLSEVFALFREDARERMRALRNAAEEHNPAALSSAAHALKSSAGNVGAKAVHQLATDLESLGNARSIEGAHAMIERLSAAIKRASSRMAEITGSPDD